MKKRVTVNLPVTVDIDSNKKTYAVKYGKVAPIKLEDGTEIILIFEDVFQQVHLAG